jgi:hypothetical protein
VVYTDNGFNGCPIVFTPSTTDVRFVEAVGHVLEFDTLLGEEIVLTIKFATVEYSVIVAEIVMRFKKVNHSLF